MALKPHQKQNFETLRRAAVSGRMALIEGRRTDTDEPVPLLCAINIDGDMFELTPLAELIEGDPFAQYKEPQATRKPGSF